MYTKATSVEEAATASGEFRAGGTDLQERLRHHAGTSPLIDIHGIAGLDEITFYDGGADIGALCRIQDVGDSSRMQNDYPALTLPCQIIATPQIRHMGTMGGVLAQRTRCHYYRSDELDCPKKGHTDTCPSREGFHHFGVCFDFGPCVYPHPSSIACALLTYPGTEIEVTNRGRISVEALYGDGSDVARDNTLDAGQMITQIHLPEAVAGERAAYFRQMSRTWAEWPLVEVVARLVLDGETIEAANIGIGGVANIPFRLTGVENALIGKPATQANLEAAANRAIEKANPLPETAYKLPMVTAGVLQALESAVSNTSGGKLSL